MLPTLKHNQDVLCFNWAYAFSKPKIGDIVVINHNGLDMVKRIQKIHDREIIVKGDNKDQSTDSRNFGPIKRSEILGQVIWHSHLF